MSRWIIYDPFIASSNETTVSTHDTKEEAENELERLLIADNDGYCGCEVVEEGQYD
jgi:hypothetical protein